MKNLSKASEDKVSKNQVIRSNVAKTQQPDAERLRLICYRHNFLNGCASFNVIEPFLE